MFPVYLQIFFKKIYFEEHLHTAASDTKEISIPANTIIWDKKDVILFTWYSKS